MIEGISEAFSFIVAGIPVTAERARLQPSWAAGACFWALLLMPRVCDIIATGG